KAVRVVPVGVARAVLVPRRLEAAEGEPARLTGRNEVGDGAGLEVVRVGRRLVEADHAVDGVGERGGDGGGPEHVGGAVLFEGELAVGDAGRVVGRAVVEA